MYVLLDADFNALKGESENMAFNKYDWNTKICLIIKKLKLRSIILKCVRFSDFYTL